MAALYLNNPMHSTEISANLQKFLTTLNPSLTLNKMLTNVARQLVDMFGVDHCGVLLFGDEDVQGEVIAEYPSRNAEGLKIPLQNFPLVDKLKSKRRPIAVRDAQNDPIMGIVQRTMQTLDVHSIMIIPLIVQGKLIGGIGLAVIQVGRVFTLNELELSQIIGNQIAIAIDYTGALNRMEETHRQTQILREMGTVFGESLDLDQILPLVLEQLEKVLPVDGSSIYLLAGDHIQLKARRGGYSPLQYQQIIPLERLWGAAEIVKTKAPLLVNDTAEHPQWDHIPGSALQSWLGIPLIANGEVVGVLNMDGYSPNRLNETHIPMALSFANQSAMAIYNAQLYSQAKTRADLLASVQEIGLRIVATRDLEDILQAVITSVLELLTAGQARIYLYEPETNDFTLAALLDNAGQLKMKLSQPRDEGVTATVARTGKVHTISDILADPLYLYESGVHGFRAIASVPLKKIDKILGVLNVFYADPHYFSPEEIDALQLLATQTAVAMENARLYISEQARLRDEVKRVEQWRRVQEITSTLNASLDLDEILNNACEQFTQLIEIDHCAVILLDNAYSGHIVAEYPSREAIGLSLPLDYPAFQKMLHDRQPFVSFNAPHDVQLGQIRDILQSVGVKSILIAPLVVQGHVIGTVGLDAIEQQHYFTDEEISMIRVVTDQMAIAVTNARTYQAERTARNQADTLRDVAAILGETLDLNQVLERILAQLERVVTYNTSSIILREQDYFHVEATHGHSTGMQKVGGRIDFADRPHFQHIERTGKPLVIPDTCQFEGWPQANPTVTRSWLGAPLMVADKLTGILAIEHEQPNFYDNSHADLLTAFAGLAAVALGNARLYEFEVKQIEQELNIARQIQQGFFPEHIPELSGWQIAAICQPARETGGDFYEFVVRPDGLLGVVVGDVSGKSIQAAMLMADAHSVVRSKGSDHQSPAKVMRETNRLLYDDVPTGSFVALSYALLAPQEGNIYLSSGGQVAPFLVPANGQPIHLVETAGARLPLGVLPDTYYEEMGLSLAPGDLLVFHSDGLIEQHNRQGNILGFEGVIAILEDLRGQPPQIVLETLLHAADYFADGLGPHDDITLVVLQHTAN